MLNKQDKSLIFMLIAKIPYKNYTEHNFPVT